MGWRRSRRGSTVILTVSDDGIGMDKKNLSKVFNRFFREDRRRDAGGSTGLGLSIAKWIAEQHGGSIGVDSKKDKGTVFTVVLPSGRRPAFRSVHCVLIFAQYTAGIGRKECA